MSAPYHPPRVKEAQLLGALLILAAGVLIARWLGRFTDARLQRQAMEPPLRLLIVRAIKIVVLLFAFVVALDKFGFQIAPLVAGIGVAGLGIGIALQGVLSNVVAGLVHADRSRVVIPNRKIVGEILHNFGTMRQLTLTVTVPHDADLARVLAVTREAVRANPRSLKDPAPIVGVAAVTDSGIKVTAQPWVRVPDAVVADAEIYEELVERFRAVGLSFPVPLRHVRLLDGARGV